MSNQTFGFLGAGRMATALARGIVEAGIAPATQVVASDPAAEVRGNFCQAIPGARATDSNLDLVAEADVLVVAVKPQVIDQLLAEISPAVGTRPLVMSIAAGVPLTRIERALATGVRVVRVMPNTPCLVRRGASAYSLGTHATAEDGALVNRLFSAVGLAIELPEELIDPVTGLSGSGPAFVYTMVEGLASGGVAQGLSSEDALRLAAHTVAGGAAMLLETGKSPAELRDAVTSPGGTTVAGLAALEENGFTRAIVAAVTAATNRSRELGASVGSQPTAEK